LISGAGIGFNNLKRNSYPGGGVENFFELWVGLVRAPEETLRARKGTLYDAATNVAVASVLVAAVYIVLAIVRNAISGSAGGIAAGFNFAVILAANDFTLFFIGALGIFIIAKLLGGKGTYRKNAYYLSFVFTLVPLMTLVRGILGLIPYLGILATIAVVLYEGYLYVIAIKVANSFTLARAVAVVAIPLLLLIILAASRGFESLRLSTAAGA
jgi:hypothetical protein